MHHCTPFLRENRVRACTDASVISRKLMRSHFGVTLTLILSCQHPRARLVEHHLSLFECLVELGGIHPNLFCNLRGRISVDGLQDVIHVLHFRGCLA
jgi:hypothetical protein